MSDRIPPSSCERTAVCFTASTMTYQQTYFRWLVLLSVTQHLKKKQKKQTDRLFCNIFYFTHMFYMNKHMFQFFVQLLNSSLLLRLKLELC